MTSASISGVEETDDLGPELVELTEPTGLGPFVPEARSEVEQFERAGIVGQIIDEETDDRCGELWAEADLPVPLVLEGVDLIDDPWPGLGGEELGVLEGGGLDLAEAMGQTYRPHHQLSKYLLVSISEGPKSLVPRGLWIICRAEYLGRT